MSAVRMRGYYMKYITIIFWKVAQQLMHKQLHGRSSYRVIGSLNHHKEAEKPFPGIRPLPLVLKGPLKLHV